MSGGLNANLVVLCGRCWGDTRLLVSLRDCIGCGYITDACACPAVADPRRTVEQLTAALNEKVQAYLDGQSSERKNALYERDRRLNEPPASYAFRDPFPDSAQQEPK
jgi:Na+-translocating ferredoxin:NAD+ oxidoreductase RnfC subunit